MSLNAYSAYTKICLKGERKREREKGDGFIFAKTLAY
jgi:hypothetical protein